MPRQFDIYRSNDDVLVLVIQSDLLEHLPTRVVIPLVSSRDIAVPFQTLMPVVMSSDIQMRLLPQQIATVMTSSLVTHVGSAAHLRDDIIRACDMLITGY